MNKFKIRTLKKKENIINAALLLFGKNGFSDVNIKDIAKLANVSQVSIYNYFKSKEFLVYECAKIIMKEVIDISDEILNSDKNFISKIEEAISICNTNININLSKFISEKANKDTQFIKLITNNINILKKEIYMKYIKYGKKENKINNDISNDTIELFIDSINNIGLLIPIEDLELKQTEIIHLFLYGIIGNSQN